jgi:hypothetical protein
MIQRSWKIRLDSATGEREHARRLENTSVALVKYEDYACLYCGRASPDGAGDAQIHSVSGGGDVIRAGRGMPPSCGSAKTASPRPAPAPAVGYRGCRQTGRRWHGYGKFTGPKEVADRIVLLASDGQQRHWLQLRHRRQTHHPVNSKRQLIAHQAAGSFRTSSGRAGRALAAEGSTEAPGE